MRHLLPILGLCAALSAAVARADAPVGGWESPALADHSLVGKIWDARAERFIEREVLIATLREADSALLGERHDNPDHHRLQAELIAALAERGWAEAVVFEMLSDAQAGALPDPGDAVDPDDLGKALDWEARGWFDWPIYRPVFAAALDGGLRLLPGNPTREALMRFGWEGPGSLPEGEPARLALDRTLPDGVRARLLDRIEAAHCGYAKRERLGPMLDAQRFKDATLADRLLAAGPGVVLIAGAGHVRRDWAVPWYLHERDPMHRTAALAFIEVRAGAEGPAAYEDETDDAPAFDYLWFTPRVDTADPCEKLEDRLKAMQGDGSPRHEADPGE